MKKKEKILILALIIMVIIVVLIGKARKKDNLPESPSQEVVQENENNAEENEINEEFVEVLDDGTKVNTSETLKEEKKVDDLSFTNMQLTNSDGQTVLLADVTNTGSTATELTLYDVIILDKDGNEVVTLGGLVSPLEPGETTQFNVSMTRDYANAYDFKIVKK